MSSKHLSKREKWQLKARRNEEKCTNSFLLAFLNLSENHGVVIDNPLKIQYNASNGFVLDWVLSLDNRKIYFECKNQNKTGNAHERAYKYHPLGGISSFIRRKENLNYHPVFSVFGGDMVKIPKYIDEINIMFSNCPNHYLLWKDYDFDIFSRWMNTEIFPRLKGERVDDY